MTENIIIRHYQAQDRQCIRDIAWNTALMGESAQSFFSDKEVFTCFLTEYFTDYEPESCFVAEDNGRVVGYLLGTIDTARMEKIFLNKIFLPLLLKIITYGSLFKPKNAYFFLQCFFSFVKQEFKMPDFSKDYPATLHINIEKDWRSRRIGSRLIGSYLKYLDERKVLGVYLSTMSDKAAGFFSKQGFDLLHRGKRSYLRYLLHRNIPVYIYGRRLI